MVSDCSPELNSKMHYDKYNPCGENYSDSLECESWRTKYPKEYKRYLDRLEKIKQDSMSIN